MNWKVLVGILLVLGAAIELFDELKDYSTGVTPSNYFLPELICLAAICGGIYLIYKGRKKKPGL